LKSLTGDLLANFILADFCYNKNRTTAKNHFMLKKSLTKFPSELRLDLVSQDWVVIATGRAQRPEMFKKLQPRQDTSQDCPFCFLDAMSKPSAVFIDGRLVDFSGKKIPINWSVIVKPNKFPAFVPAKQLKEEIEGGLYKKMPAVGFHEVVILREHNVELSQLTLAKMEELLAVYQQRYLALVKEKFVNHISIFHNRGSAAGASISHPHSQIITTPLVDLDLKKSSQAASDYFKKRGECVYCQMARWELKAKKRLVFENNGFVALCPFASKVAFEVIISPKTHLSYFEKISKEERQDLAQAMLDVLGKLDKGLGSPDYNFYLHTAPTDGSSYPFYHWHFTIMPKTSIPAGFEIGTQMEISTIEPEKAAQYLQSIK
jgi:UDPglucose--hexose-1-phosphate uridylyltransferase